MSFHTENVTLTTGKWTITGISVGGTHTTIVINELKICFDIGVLTNESTHCDKVLISHGHIDHCQSFYKHYRCRKLRKMMPPAVYIIPPIMDKPMRDVTRAQFNMEKGLKNISLTKNSPHIIPLQAGELYRCEQNSHSSLDIIGYPMTHRIPAYGYSVISEVQKLKKDFIELPGNEIRELRKKGVDIFYTKRIIEIAYTGDTTITGILRQPDMLNAQVLIMECTIIDERITPKETHKRGHVHIQDIVDNWKMFKNEHIVLFHFSPRYSGSVLLHDLVKNVLKDLPIEFTKKVQLLWPKKDSTAFTSEDLLDK